MSSHRPLAEALLSSPLFFEPVPPPARMPAARRDERVEAVARLLRSVPRLDALDVPELADENHEGKPRYRSGDIRPFARLLQERVGREAIVNKVVAYVDPASELGRWAETTANQQLRHVVLVGGASRYIPYPGPSVAEANRICRPIFERVGGRIGNIAIPQREGEPHRMLQKTRVGASFFTTQILFDSDQVVEMIRRYDLLCRQAATPPAAVLLSFAPLADEQDVEFVRWLGADLPEAAERAILEGEDPEAERRSEERALEVWATVARAAEESGLEVPLGVNVEQISPRHLEAAGHLLAEFAARLPRAAPAGGSPDPGPSRPLTTVE